MKKLPATVSTARAILCVVLCVVFASLTVFQFCYHGALAEYRVALAQKTAAIKAERDAAVAALNETLAARDTDIAALTLRANGLAARLVSLTGSESGTAEDCLRLLIAAALREQDGKVGSTESEEAIAAQVDAYMNTHASTALEVAEQLLFLDYLYRTNYIGEIDPEHAAEEMARAYAKAAGDVYGVYYDPEEYEAYRRRLNSGVCGIGCVAGRADGGAAVELLHVHSQSPAAAAGLLAGDLIRALDGVSVTELGYDNALDKMSGEAGSQIILTVERGGATLSFTVQRAESDADVVISRTYVENGVKIGYMRIINFTALTYRQLTDAIEAAEDAGAEALVFDVRDNTGGLLSSIINVLNYMLPKGTPIVSYEYKNQNNARPVRYAESEHTVDLPIYVLQNQKTASAAELFSAVLQENGATVIGTDSYGKGTMQTGYQLEDGSYVTVSVALYAPGVGENYEGEGVHPDYAAKPNGIWEQASIWKLPYEQDLALQKALSLATEE